MSLYRLTYHRTNHDNIHVRVHKGISLKQQLKDKLIEHKQYIDKCGEDLQKIVIWKWGATNASKPA